MVKRHATVTSDVCDTVNVTGSSTLYAMILDVWLTAVRLAPPPYVSDKWMAFRHITYSHKVSLLEDLAHVELILSSTATLQNSTANQRSYSMVQYSALQHRAAQHSIHGTAILYVPMMGWAAEHT